jgi:hypothetical protein
MCTVYICTIENGGGGVISMMVSKCNMLALFVAKPAAVRPECR